MATEFDWLTLEEGEKVLWSSRAHRYSLYVGMVFGVIFLFVGSILAWLNYQNTHYVVTNRRIYAKRGIVSRNVKTVDFDKVQNINYTQGALGAHFGYGNVEISTAGSSGAEVTFRSIPDPADVQELIDREIKRGQGTEGGTSESTDDVLDEVVSELRAIRQLLEGETGAHEASGEQPGQQRSTDTQHRGDSGGEDSW
jgi:uncharacterized membrane protein YdbT with pleckstrin-like domain